MSARRYSAWQVLGFAAVTLAVVGAAGLTGFAAGFRWGRVSARAVRSEFFHAPSFTAPSGPDTLPLPEPGAYLGVTYVEVTPEVARRQGLPVTAGALIRRVHDGSPAQAADLRTGDVILSVDGAPIGPSHNLRGLVKASSPGQSLTLTVLRAGQTLDVRVTLAAAPGS